MNRSFGRNNSDCEIEVQRQAVGWRLRLSGGSSIATATLCAKYVRLVGDVEDVGGGFLEGQFRAKNALE